LTFGSAAERLYDLDLGAARPRILRKFRPTARPVKGQQVNWWEGPVAIGPRGNIYAGNTGGTAYALTPAARIAWRFTSGGSMSTQPAFAADGASFWGSLDLNVYRLDASGRPLWRTFTPGFVISSPAIGFDGTVYVGSFDSKLYALDPASSSRSSPARGCRCPGSMSSRSSSRTHAAGSRWLSTSTRRHVRR
jgi:outer membrane protein assembly factor BamB